MALCVAQINSLLYKRNRERERECQWQCLRLSVNAFASPAEFSVRNVKGTILICSMRNLVEV